MEGSIADSTALRMRAQLQRMHHSSPTSGPDGFLEELLKMPAATVSDPDDQTTPDDTSLDNLPAPSATKTDDKPQSGTDGSKEKEEPTDDASSTANVAVCYAPMQTIQSLDTDAPEPEAADPKVVSQVVSTPVEAAVTEPTSDVPTVAVDEPQVVVDADTPVPTAEVEESQTVQPIDTNLTNPAAQVKDKPAKVARDPRRAAEGRKESGVENHQAQQTVNDSAANSQAQAKPIDDRPKQISEEPTKEDAQPIAAQDTSQPVATAESKRDAGDERGERDKWYEKPTNGEDASPSLVDRLQDAASDRQANDPAVPGVEQANATNATDPSTTSVDASALTTDASSQASIDNLQVMSDMAAAAQASAAQSASAQTVGQSSSASGADLSGRGRQSSGQPSNSINATGTSGIGQSNGAMTGRTGATQAAAASSSKEASEGSHEITQQERVRLVQRVARSFSRLGPEGGQVTLKLHPPQLGVLNVSIKIEGQSMTARMQTETGAARDAIVENLSVLRDRLKEQGIEIEKFQVEVGQQDDLASGAGQSGTFFSSGSNSQQDNAPASNDYDLRRVARGSASRTPTVAPPVWEPKLQNWPTMDRTLDVRA